MRGNFVAFFLSRFPSLLVHHSVKSSGSLPVIFGEPERVEETRSTTWKLVRSCLIGLCITQLRTQRAKVMKLGSEAGQTREAAIRAPANQGIPPDLRCLWQENSDWGVQGNSWSPNESRISGEETYIMCGQFGVVHGLLIKSSFSKWILPTRNLYVEVLMPRTSEYYCIWS